MTRLHPLRLLLLVVMAVVWPALASAATVVQLETRVRGIELVAHALVGGSSAPSPEKHLGSSPAYDEIAPGYYSLAAEGAAAVGPRATLKLALEVQGNVPRGVQRVSILETAEGRTLVGGGVMDLRPDQIARALERGLEPVAAPGLHAERTVVQGAYQRGLTPRAGIATNNVCAGSCAPFVRLGGWVLDKWYGF